MACGYDEEHVKAFLLGWLIGGLCGILISAYINRNIEYNALVKAKCELIDSRLEYQACMKQLKP